MKKKDKEHAKVTENSGPGAVDARKKRGEILLIVCIILSAGLTAMYLPKDRPEKDTIIMFHENEAMRTLDTPVTMAEFMLYALGVKENYDESMEDHFYAQIGTNTDGEEETYENIVKEEIAESIRIVKALCAAAETEYGITLSKDEEMVLKSNADAYYETLLENGVDPVFLPQEIVRKYIREEYLSQKVYGHLKKQYNVADQIVVDVRNEQAEDGKAMVDMVSDELAEEIAKLVEKYDHGYSYKTNINWELMDFFRFYEPKDLNIDNVVNTLSWPTGTEKKTEGH